MHSIIKNLSTVLALTTLFTNFSPVFATKPKLPKATVHTATGPNANISLKGSRSDCLLCAAKFNKLNDLCRGWVAFDPSLLDNNSAPVVLRFLNEFDLLFKRFLRFTFALASNRALSDEPLLIRSLETPSPRPLGDGYLIPSVMTFPLGTVEFGLLDSDHRRSYIGNRDNHLMEHFDDHLGLESTVAHRFATLMILLYAEKTLLEDILSRGPASVARHLSSPDTLRPLLLARYNASAKTIWENLATLIPDLKDPQSELYKNLGTARFSTPGAPYGPSIAALFSHCCTSSLAPDDVKRTVFSVLDELFPPIDE